MTDQNSEEKKDLTSIIQISKKLLESGEAPPAPEGSLMEEAPIEKIDHFESLEDYSANNPPPPEPVASEISSVSDVPPNDAVPLASNSMSEESPAGNIAGEPSAGSEATPDITPEGAALFGSEHSESASNLSEANFDSAPTFDNNSLLSSPSPPSSEYGTSDFPVTPPDIASQDLASQNSTSPPPAQAASIPVMPTPPKKDPPKPAASSLDKVKEYSEKISPAKPAVPATYPFSVLIQGNLSPEDKEKIQDLVTREDMGIREIDLEPQLTSGKVLIPRVSEYAAIFLVQALRGIQAKIKMGPSDSIFATQDTRSEDDNNFDEQTSQIHMSIQSGESHPAENLPITSEGSLPEIKNFKVVDLMSTSALLESQAVETENSPAYLEVVEALQRELKYKAYRKGATAILYLNIKLHYLSSPGQYRVHVMGTAVKPRTEDFIHEPMDDSKADSEAEVLLIEKQLSSRTPPR